MTAQSIIKHLEDSDVSLQSFAHEDYDVKALDLGEIVEVKQKGGEDQGSEWFSVKHFKEHDVYLLVPGYYSSYDGVNFDGWESVYEVKPKEVNVMRYVKI